MPSKQYPFIDIAVHEHVRTRFAAGEALVLFSDDMEKVLWANGAGAGLFSHDFIYDFLDAGLPSSDVTARQIKSTAGQLLKSGDKRSFLMRITTNFQRVTIQANLELINDRSGDPVILFSAPTTEKPLPLSQRAKLMLSGFDDPDTHMAVLASNGSVMASSPDFANIGMTQETLLALVKAVSRDADQLLKRPVPTGRGYLPAAIGKLSDDPALHLLFCVETAIGQMDPTDDDTFAQSAPSARVGGMETTEQMSVDRQTDLATDETNESTAEQPAHIAFDDALDAVSHIENAPDEPTELDAIVEIERDSTKPLSEDRGLATGLLMLNGTIEDDMSLSYANETADDLADLTALHALDSAHYDGVPNAHVFPKEFEAEYQAFSTNSLPLDDEALPVLQVNDDSGLVTADQHPLEAREASPGSEPAADAQAETIDSRDAELQEGSQAVPTESALFAATPDHVETYVPENSPLEMDVQQVSEATVSSETRVEPNSDDIAAPQTNTLLSTGADGGEIAGTELPVSAMTDAILSDIPVESAAVVAPESSLNDAEQELAQPEPETAVASETDASDATIPVVPAFQFARNSRPVRFVWKVDASGKFSEISEEFAQAVGPRAAAINDLYFADVARAFKMDPDGKIGDLLQKRDTWSGKTIYWPVEGTSLKVPVDLAALPTYSRSRSFDGFRGFGIVRLVDAIEDPDQIGSSLGTQPEAAIAEPAFDPSVDEKAPALSEIVPSVSAETNADSAASSSETEPEADVESTTISDIVPIVENVNLDEPAALAELEQTEAVTAVGETFDEAPSDVSVETIEPAVQPQETVQISGSDELIETGDDIEVATVSHEETALSPPVDFAEPVEEQTAAEIVGETSGENQPADLLMSTDVINSDAEETEQETVAIADLENTDSDEPILQAEVASEDSQVAPDTETVDGETGQTSDVSNALISSDPSSTPNLDDFQGEKPALRIFENPGRRHSDKVISIDAHRGKSREGLSLSEQAAFQEIARQLDPFGKRLPQNSQKDQSNRLEGLPAPKPAGTDASQNANTDLPTSGLLNSDKTTPTPALQDDVAALIPSRTKSEEQLSASFVDALPLAILVHTGENLIHANPEFFRLTGYESLEQLKNYGGLDALLEQDQAPRTSDETPAMLMVTAQGTLEPVTARLQSIRWEESHALLLALVPKRTDREREAAAKAASENTHLDPEAKITALTIEVDELRSILETATDGVVIVGQDGDIRSMNKSASALFNFDDEDTRGKSFAMLFAHESQKAVMDYLAGLAGHGVASVLNDGREVIGREASGGFIPLFMTMGRLSSSNGYCADIRDITQWKRTEEELRTAKRAAETANAHKSEFLARVSHEIRTPLNAIIGFSDMMATERLGPIGHPRYVEYSDDIGRSGRHVLDIVNDLLDISKIEAGEMDLEFTAVELNEAVSEAVSLVQPQVNSQRVIIRTSLSQSVPNIVADQRSIKQIAINILANAIRYTPSGGQIVVSTAYESNGSVVLRIRDTGVGMTRTELEQALKPFRQVTTGARKRGDGTGLGLPLTKAMVDANRANFAISSAPNEGTLVEITFPSPRVLAN